MKAFNFWYYTIALLAVVAGVGMYLAVTRGVIAAIEPNGTLGQVAQYVVIFDTIACVPLGLWWNAKRDQLVGMLIASHPMIPAIACAYWMGGYPSMLWLVGISAIAWYFCKHRQEFFPEQPTTNL